jgi:hypothetical protein
MNLKITTWIILLLLLFGLFVSGCANQKTSDTAKEQVSSEQQEPVTEEQSAPDFKLSSKAFENGGKIPVIYCMSQITGGKNVSPPLEWTNPPAGTKSFALICYDTHTIANNWIHWLVVDIPADVRQLEEGASGTDKMKGARELTNTFGFKGWGGPMPPEGSGTHNYEFHLYALSVEKLDLSGRVTFQEFQNAISGKVVAEAVLVGTYSR